MSRDNRNQVKTNQANTNGGLRMARYALVILHDLACAALSYWMAAFMILPFQQFTDGADVIVPFAAIAGVGSILISFGFGVFSTRWRLASLTDFVALIKSALCLTAALFAARFVAHLLYPEPFFAAEVRIICLGGIFVLGAQATGRIAYRYYHFLRRRKSSKTQTEATIFVGAISEAEGALRAAEQGMLSANIVACLLPRGSRMAKQIRSRPILGTSDDLDYAFNMLAAGGQNVTSLLLSAGFLAKPDEAHEIKRAARRLGLTLLKIETVGIGGRAEVRFEDFLFRSKRRIDHRAIDAVVAGKRVLITGGGGTIGGDIALRAAAHGASAIFLLDISELGLQTRLAQLRREYPATACKAVICDVRDRDRLEAMAMQLRPDVMVHAAALKHVDLVEENWQEAIRTNVFGTLNALGAADRAAVPVLVNISTDKAADPVGMLGFTKRAGEVLVAAHAQASAHRRFSVRFGNVLGSSGSVVEVFLAQIAAGGPITLTDPRVRRYFMSRDEAAELVLSAGSLADLAPLYLLDMGEPISIRDLAVEMIEWAGFVPDEDIKIVTTHLRPGERLEEQLVATGERLEPTDLEGIRAVRVLSQVTRADVEELQSAILSGDKAAATMILQRGGAVGSPLTSVAVP